MACHQVQIARLPQKWSEVGGIVGKGFIPRGKSLTELFVVEWCHLGQSCLDVRKRREVLFPITSASCADYRNEAGVLRVESTLQEIPPVARRMAFTQAIQYDDGDRAL